MDVDQNTCGQRNKKLDFSCNIIFLILAGGDGSCRQGMRNQWPSRWCWITNDSIPQCCPCILQVPCSWCSSQLLKSFEYMLLCWHSTVYSQCRTVIPLWNWHHAFFTAAFLLRGPWRLLKDLSSCCIHTIIFQKTH